MKRTTAEGFMAEVGPTDWPFPDIPLTEVEAVEWEWDRNARGIRIRANIRTIVRAVDMTFTVDKSEPRHGVTP